MRGDFGPACLCTLSRTVLPLSGLGYSFSAVGWTSPVLNGVNGGHEWKFTAVFKAPVAKEALGGEKTVWQIATRHEVNPSQRKRKVREGLVEPVKRDTVRRLLPPSGCREICQPVLRGRSGSFYRCNGHGRKRPDDVGPSRGRTMKANGCPIRRPIRVRGEIPGLSKENAVSRSRRRRSTSTVRQGRARIQFLMP